MSEYTKDQQCKAHATKKAWKNRLAPLARCEMKALDGKHFCARHQRKAAELEARQPGSWKHVLAERFWRVTLEWLP